MKARIPKRVCDDCGSHDYYGYPEQHLLLRCRAIIRNLFRPPLPCIMCGGRMRRVPGEFWPENQEARDA